MPYFGILMVVFLVVSGIAMWNGKGTFMISGYRKIDPEKTDMQKVHRINALESFALALGCVITTAGWYLGSRAVMWAGLAVMIVLYAALVFYEKTGNHLSR